MFLFWSAFLFRISYGDRHHVVSILPFTAVHRVPLTHVCHATRYQYPLYVGPGLVAIPSASATPAPTTAASVFTTTYDFTAQAADATSDWLATYTIQEVCTGDPATWTPPPVPPNFVAVTVTCDACATPTQTITCPLEAAARTGSVSIWGSGGLTATPVPDPSWGEGVVPRSVWWAGELLTQSGSPTGNYALGEPTGTEATGDAATVWGNLALLSGCLALAVGVLLWQ